MIAPHERGIARERRWLRHGAGAPQDAVHGCQQGVGVGRSDIEMGHDAQPALADHRHRHVAFAQAAAVSRASGAASSRSAITMLVSTGSTRATAGRPARPSPIRLRQGMVLGQAVDMVVEGVEAHGGQHAGLAHRAAPAPLQQPRRIDEVGDPASTAPTGQPRPLVKAIQALSKPRA
jgi:hypothetical protein